MARWSEAAGRGMTDAKATEQHSTNNIGSNTNGKEQHCAVPVIRRIR